MPVRLGIIGTGNAARSLHWPALAKLQDRFEIVAVANRTLESAQNFARLVGTNPRVTSDYRELLAWPEVEAVDIAVPIVMNASVAAEALRAGKHVIVEKPIAANLTDAQALIDQAHRHPDLTVLVAENVRYEPRFRKALQLLRDRHIGRVAMIHSDVLAPLRPDSTVAGAAWRLQPQHLGGYLGDGGVHRTAALHLLAGRVSQVHGLVTSFGPDSDPPDTLLANLRFNSGAVGHLTYSVGVREREPWSVRVYGTEGSLIVHYDRLAISGRDGVKEITFPSSPSGFDLEFADFHAAITERRPPDVSLQDAFDDLEVIDAVLRSARERRVITLREM